MNNFREIVERTTLEQLVQYLLYGSDSELERQGTFEEQIKNAYDNVFDKLEEMFPTANRNQDDFHNIILEFAVTYGKVYMEIGLINGFNLYRNFDRQTNLFTTVCLGDEEEEKGK